MSYFGYHVGGESLMECLNNMPEGTNAIQLFTTHPKDLFRRIGFDEATEFTNTCKRRGIYVVSHCILMTNFASTEARKRVFSINLLCAEVKRCIPLGIKDIVIHPGSSDSPSRVTDLASAINAFFERLISYRVSWKGKILVENMVGAKDMLPMLPEEYHTLFSEIKPEFVDQVGICLDTAHCWGYGLTPAQYIDAFKKYGIMNKLYLVHFNNNVYTLGSKKERHCDLSKGSIPESVLFDLREELNDSVPFIVELK